MRDTEPTHIHLHGTPVNEERVAAVYRCHRGIEQLAPTDDPDIKYCDGCKQRVFKVVDFDGLVSAVASKGCVWGPAQRDDQATLFVGEPTVTYPIGTKLELGD